MRRVERNDNCVEGREMVFNYELDGRLTWTEYRCGTDIAAGICMIPFTSYRFTREDDCAIVVNHNIYSWTVVRIAHVGSHYVATTEYHPDRLRYPNEEILSEFRFCAPSMPESSSAFLDWFLSFAVHRITFHDKCVCRLPHGVDTAMFKCKDVGLFLAEN